MEKLFLMMLAAGLLLGGCANSDTSRYTAWKDVRQAEETTSQEYLKTKAVELAAQPKVVIDSKDEMTTYALITAIKALGGNKTDTYGVDLRKTDMPQDEWAERIESVGKAAVKIGNTPAAVVMGTGWAVGRVAADGFAAAGDRYTAQGDLKVQGSHNSQAISVEGDENGVSAVASPSASSHDDRSTQDDHSVGKEPEEGDESGGRCRDNDSCPAGSVCSRQDGEVGQCISESAY